MIHKQDDLDEITTLLDIIPDWEKAIVKEYIKKELYLSISLDRTKRMPLIMLSKEGGVDIESVSDEKIYKEWKFAFDRFNYNRQKIDTQQIKFRYKKQI